MDYITRGKYLIKWINEKIFETPEYIAVGVRDINIERAIKLKKRLVVQTDGGEADLDPNWVKKNCKKFDFVKYVPDVPMKFYEIKLTRKDPRPLEAFI